MRTRESASGLLRFQRAVASIALMLSIGLAAGCASIPANSGADPRDPLETFNRHMFAFNEGVDQAVLKPVAEVYKAVLPDRVRECFGNAFSNLREPATAFNNLLQGKPADAVADTCRFVVNTTVGLLGCFDVAAKMGLARNREDFGQTLGVWGAGPGPFLVLPLLGPSSIRDAVGTFTLDSALDPNFWIENETVRNWLFGVRLVDGRAQLLQTESLVSDAALDKYTFIRDGYLQRRRHMVHDGNPPRLTDPDDEDPPKGPPSGGSDVESGKPSSTEPVRR